MNYSNGTFTETPERMSVKDAEGKYVYIGFDVRKLSKITPKTIYTVGAGLRSWARKYPRIDDSRYIVFDDKTTADTFMHDMERRTGLDKLHEESREVSATLAALKKRKTTGYQAILDFMESDFNWTPENTEG